MARGCTLPPSQGWLGTVPGGSCGLLESRGWVGAGRIERHRARTTPVAGGAAPAFRSCGLGLFVERLALGEDGHIGTAVTLLGGDEAELAVAVLAVVPAHELEHPLARLGEVGKAVDRIAGAVLQGAKQRLGIGVPVRSAIIA